MSIFFASACGADTVVFGEYEWGAGMRVWGIEAAWSGRPEGADLGAAEGVAGAAWRGAKRSVAKGSTPLSP